MIKVKYITLLIVSFLFLSLTSSVGTQTQNDLLEKRDNYVLRFINGGPDLQFYLRSDENSSQFRYTLHWKEIVEYTDKDNDGLYTEADTTVTTEDLTQLSFERRTIWSEIHDAQNNLVSGKQFNFTHSLRSNTASMSIAVDWWEGTVNIPYAGDSIHIDQKESKFSFTISDWKFDSPGNRLAVNGEIVTTTPIEKYAIANLDNGSFGMLTLDNVDGKGHRGGIINNPLNVELDNGVASINRSVSNNGVSLDLQYNFPSFTKKLHYDPTYSAVAVPTLPAEYKDQTDPTSKAQGAPGFEFDLVFSTVILLIIFRKRINR